MSTARRGQTLALMALLVAALTAGSCPDTPKNTALCGSVTAVNPVTDGAISATIDDAKTDASYILDVAVGSGTKQFVGQSEAGGTYIFAGLPSGTFNVTWFVSGCTPGAEEQVIPGPATITVP